MLIGKGDGLRTRKNRLDIVLSLTDSADNFVFRLDGFGGRELTSRNAEALRKIFELLDHDFIFVAQRILIAGDYIK